MEKTILILGATGNIGGKAAELLLNQGLSVRVCGRIPEKLESLKQKGAEVFQGDLSDSEFVQKLFTNVSAAFTLLPPKMDAPDLKTYQDHITANLVAAITQQNVKYVLNLSSVGAHVTEGNGSIAGLARQEKAFNQIEGLNVIHIRAGYFMENAFWSLDLIKNMGISGSPTTPANLKIPMIATKDIADFVAKNLKDLNFSGKSTQALLGPKDITLEEYTAVLAKAIGKENLNYVQFPADQAKQSMVQMGMSESVAEGMVEIQLAVGTDIMSQVSRKKRRKIYYPNNSRRICTYIYLCV
ncbi:MAG: SDR family NAD(P)-dependent oxidoreductase [Sphingobacteriia bacterium]|nr:SDR family NAD(P)-dependent oxidoreductase [Sphingobacteriia bacterium]